MRILNRKIIQIVFFSLYAQYSYALYNPFQAPGSQVPDAKLGAFRQNNTGDCFFLTSLLALAQDPDGASLLQRILQRSTKETGWEILFPGFSTLPISVTAAELQQYTLMNSPGNGISLAVIGDSDVRLLEIAADKLWKKHIKPEGLWDDNSMNAWAMFTDNKQVLLWNREQVKSETLRDIEKYHQLAGKRVRELLVSSVAEAMTHLKNIVSNDTDGLSMVLLDYIRYHAVAVVSVDFIENRYYYIDTASMRIQSGAVDQLLQRLIQGQYALNYLEITSPTIPGRQGLAH